jgi:hypothetical protein
MKKLHDYSKIILTATAVSLRVFMAAIVSSSSADECKGCSSLEDWTQTAAGFLLGEIEVVPKGTENFQHFTIQ